MGCACGAFYALWNHNWDQEKPVRKGGRRHISLAVRQEVMKAHGAACLKCGSPDDITMDHVLPIVMGGTNEACNLQPLCYTCNQAKADLFIDYRKK